LPSARRKAGQSKRRLEHIRIILKIPFARWLVALMFLLAGVKFWRRTGFGRISGREQQSINVKMKHILENLPGKAQRAEVHFLDFLTQFLHAHVFYSLMAIMCVLILFLIYFLVVVSRHHAEHGAGESGVRSGVIFQFGQNPPRESDSFNPFPPYTGRDEGFDD
jgi:hypothetical protein